MLTLLYFSTFTTIILLPKYSPFTYLFFLMSQLFPSLVFHCQNPPTLPRSFQLTSFKILLSYSLKHLVVLTSHTLPALSFVFHKILFNILFHSPTFLQISFYLYPPSHQATLLLPFKYPPIISSFHHSFRFLLFSSQIPLVLQTSSTISIIASLNLFRSSSTHRTHILPAKHSSSLLQLIFIIHSTLFEPPLDSFRPTFTQLLTTFPFTSQFSP